MENLKRILLIVGIFGLVYALYIGITGFYTDDMVKIVLISIAIIIVSRVLKSGKS